MPSFRAVSAAGLVLLGAIMALPTLASLPASRADGAHSVLTVAMGSDLRSSEPGVNRDDTSDAILNHVVEPLVAFRADLTVVPHLAERVDVSADGRDYTFVLRTGLRFHDGSAVTAQVLAWNWTRFLDPTTRWYCRSQFDGSTAAGRGGVHVTAVEALDSQRLRLRFAAPSPLILPLLASTQCQTGAYSRTSVDAAGRWVRPVGTGPFRFDEWRRGRDVVLARNRNYLARGEPGDGLAGDRSAAVEELRFLLVPESNAAVAAFNSGALDVLAYQPVSIIPDIRVRGDTQLHPQQLLGWTVLLMQTRDPLLRDARLRRAIAHAIDRRRLARTATEGRGRSNASAVPVGSPWWNADQAREPQYDPDLARRLLREAGYEGQPVSIQTNRLFKNMYDNAIMVQAMLAAVGMQARIEVFDWATQLSNYQLGRYQLSSFSYSARFDPALTYALLIGDKAERATAQWESADAARMLAKALRQTASTERAATFAALHARQLEDMPIVGLYNGVAVSATGPGVRGFRSWPGALPILWGVSKSKQER